MEREQGYLYPHNYPNHWVKQQYLPDELAARAITNTALTSWNRQGKQYWDSIKKE